MAGRCGGGAGWNAGAAGRAMTGGGAGRAIAGGAAGRAMAGGGAAGRAAGATGPCPLCSWADELTLTAITETPTKKAAKQTSRGSMLAAPQWLSSPAILNARAPKSFSSWQRFCDAVTAERKPSRQIPRNPKSIPIRSNVQSACQDYLPESHAGSELTRSGAHRQLIKLAALPVSRLQGWFAEIASADQVPLR